MKTVVYVANADDGSLHVLELHPTGHLTPVQQLELGGTVMPMTVAPDRRTLYVARRSEPLAVVALAIDPRSGQLTKLGEAALPASMAYVTTDRTGRWLLAASYPAHLVSVSSIGDDGVPRAAHQIVAGVPHAHCVRLTADNRAAFVTSLGANEVRQYRFDAAAGRLDPHVPAAVPLPPGSGPRHIEFHPVLNVAYLLDELDGQLHVFNVVGGTLRQRQCIDARAPEPPRPIWNADIRATPDGRFVYTSERTGSIVTGLRVDGASGELSPIGHWTTQRQPRAIQIDPQGRFLLSAGQLSHHVGVHSIGRDGALSFMNQVPVGRNPSWIEVVALTA